MSWRGRYHLFMIIISNILLRYTDCHNHTVITVFSAPNYCDVQLNLGAVVVVQGSRILQPEYKLFEAVDHPGEGEFLVEQLLQAF